MKRKCALLVLVAVFTSPSFSKGQGLTAFSSPTGNSTLDRAVGEMGLAGEVNASTDSKNAMVTYGWKLSTVNGREDSDSNSKNKPKASVGRFDSINITGSAPLDKDSDATDLATLDALTNAFTLGVKYTRFTVTGMRNPEDDPKASKRREEICAELTEAYQKAKESKDNIDCGTDNVQEYLPDRFDEYKTLYWVPDSYKYAWGVSGRGGYQKFEFLDPTTAGDLKESKVPWSFEGFFAFSPPKWRTLFTAGGSYQNGFKDAKNGTLCPSSSSGGTLACKTGAVGKPVNDDRELIYVEARRFLFNFAGVSPRLTYDFKQDETGVDVPISFIKNKDGSFVGGIRGGWTRKEHWQLGVFVGSAFTFFPSSKE